MDGFAIARFDALGTSCASSVASSHDSVVASEVADPVPIDLTGELNRLVLHIDDLVQPGPEQIARSRRRPGIATRFVIGLLLLKHICGLSDEGVCERWVHDPYFQYFTGEQFFQHAFPHERSDLSHWRKRLGDRLELLLAESLRVAHEARALRSQDLKRVTVDTTV